MNVFIDGDTHKVDGVDVSTMTRAQQVSITSSIFCLFESFEGVVVMIAGEFANYSGFSYSEAMKSAVLNKERVEKDSVEYDIFDLNKSIDFKSLPYDESGLRIQGDNGSIICHDKASDQEVLNGLKDALKMFLLYKKTVQKVEECFFNMKNAENRISHLAQEGKTLDMIEVSPE
ncbi:hypothetical protein [Aeromonas veronii]|uniref:Uncharacterized protein n=1 Tax=Aeromonas veronii TaxID=654 RepID=A0A2T4MWI2_AERVE|nr:hypothetical protein [Aeromonas veronii]PTH78914.1 hypothetical protein DAA48_20960 [Aeromonas veronii]